MLILLSPAKSLDFETPLPNKKQSMALYSKEVENLVRLARRLSARELEDMMKISPALAKLNVERFKNWSTNPAPDQTRPAIYAFNGDVYDGLQAKTLSCNYLDKHLRIISGLYGILNPFDLIQAYRLEMGSALVNPKGLNLYAYWQDTLTEHVHTRLNSNKRASVLNLASIEYAKAIRLKDLQCPVINPVFQDYSNGQYKVVSFFAKKARGMMVRYCAENLIKSPEGVKSFDVGGYSYCEEASTNTTWIFRRNLCE
jgi:hypothetical protein